MAQRVFVKVTGFTDVERHALNTVFRLSEQRGIIYSLWDSSAPEPPKLALVELLAKLPLAELLLLQPAAQRAFDSAGPGNSDDEIAGHAALGQLVRSAKP